MLYPKEDKGNKILLFACRNCDHQEEASEHRVYRNNVMPLAIEAIQNVSGLASDPTFPRTQRRHCPKCGYHEAIFFQSHDRRRDTPMTLYFVCANVSCNHLWSDK